MTMRIETTRDRNITAHIPVALAAIANHMIEHGLPIPYRVDFPGYVHDHLTLAIRDIDLADWLASGVVIDEQTVKPLKYATGVAVTAPARLETGVTFVLHWTERRTTGLTAVTS